MNDSGSAIIRDWNIANEALAKLIEGCGWSEQQMKAANSALWREMTIPIVESERLSLKDALVLLNDKPEPETLVEALHKRPWEGTLKARASLRALGATDEGK